MKVVFDNLAIYLSISPNQTPVFAVCSPGPSWTFLPFLFLLILYSLRRCILCTMYMFSHPHVQYSMGSAVLWIYGYSCTHAFLLWGPNTHPLKFEWYRQKLLAGKSKENSQIFNEDFYLPLYLPLCPTHSPPSTVDQLIILTALFWKICKLSEMSSIRISLYTFLYAVESGVRQMKQCWLMKY